MVCFRYEILAKNQKEVKNQNHAKISSAVVPLWASRSWVFSSGRREFSPNPINLYTEEQIIVRYQFRTASV
jgi:hypothetical protein